MPFFGILEFPAAFVHIALGGHYRVPRPSYRWIRGCSWDQENRTGPPSPYVGLEKRSWSQWHEVLPTVHICSLGLMIDNIADKEQPLLYETKSTMYMLGARAGGASEKEVQRKPAGETCPVQIDLT